MPAEEESTQPDLIEYLRIISRRKWLIIGLAVLGALAALAYAETAPKVYSASAQLLVVPSRGVSTVTGTQQTISPVDVTTQIQLLQGSTVKGIVANALHHVPNVSASEAGITDVINLTVTGSNPRQVATDVDTYAKDFVTYERQTAVANLTAAELQYQDQINSITSQLSGLSVNSPGAAALGNQLAILKEELAQLQIYGASTSGGVNVTAQASVPHSPISPKKTEDILIGLGAGFLIGLLLAFIIEFLEDAVRSRDDVERIVPGAPILGTIPRVGSWKDKRDAITVTISDPNSVNAEAYRSLRSSLQFASYDDTVKAILVTSPTATDGKSSTVANLGVVFANSGKSVVVLSTDLRRPRLGKFFNMEEEIGVTSVVIGDSKLDDAVRPVANVPGLHLLGVGPIPPNPSELLASNKMAAIMTELRERFDVILVDSPPLLPVTDPVILARLCDLTLLVVGSGQTKKTHLKRAYGQLLQAGVPRIGALFNEVRRESEAAYNYSYKYSYTPHTGDAKVP